MDQVRETQKSSDNLLDNEADYSDDVYWVEVTWRHKDTSDVYKICRQEQRDDNGVESLELHRE
jgi:undecaprenyl pyrophosphate synthase